ncbi:MAG: hypothetical protein DHS20C05_06050 [Hyphococcus sp.]|nr:MAG: hypothetical protein DHS20C05_06050 [Marinicaulis sp.]
MQLRLAQLIALLLLCTACSNAEDGRSLETTLAKIEASSSLTERLPLCPAKYYGKAGSRNRQYTSYEEECTDHPGKCLRLCENGFGSYCHSLAYIVQEQFEKPDAYSHALFAASCAIGIPSGCTNRAAGMSPDDKHDYKFDLSDCLIQSYKLSCDDNEAWGCTMHGFELLEANENNLLQARASFNKACAIDPDFEACTAAKSLLGEDNPQ